MRTIAAWVALVLSVANSIALMVTFWQINKRSAQNCQRIHVLEAAGERILDSPGNLKVAFQQGEITRRQYDSTLAQIHRFDPLRERNLEAWRSADCPITERIR